MAERLQVKLLSREKPLAQMEVDGVELPCVQGYVGILPGHAAFVSELSSGVVTIQQKSGDIHYFISGGFFEVVDNQVAVLVDNAETHDEIDAQRAEAAMSRALKRLADTSNKDLDIPRALSSLARARARKRLLELRKKA